MADPHFSPTFSENAASADVLATSPEVSPVLATSFAELNLSPSVLASVAAAGYQRPTPIQAQFIPQAMSGIDVMGQAQTGTGKTAAFLLPIFERVKPGVGVTQVLILAPTRELAQQIDGVAQQLLLAAALPAEPVARSDRALAHRTEGCELIV